MRQEIKVPTLGESIQEVVVGRFIKTSGSQVIDGEEVVELETEKVNQVLYAEASGIITWSVKEGDRLKVGDCLGFLEKGEAIPMPPSPPQPPTPSPKPPPPEIPPTPPPEITPSPQLLQERGESRKKMSRIRQVIANRLVDSLRHSAMLTTFNEVDMSAIMQLRKEFQESFQKKYGTKLGLLSFFVKAVVEALKAHPLFNSYIDGEEIVERNYYDIGIAVGAERGLVVPVIRHCDKLSFALIEKKIAEYAEKARNGKLALEELEGGCFTITNGGVYGSLLSTPILNPGQVGILGMHKIEKRVVVVEEAMVIRPMMYLALSYDHRLIDGKEAIQFLIQIKEILEQPPRLLLFEE